MRLIVLALAATMLAQPALADDNESAYQSCAACHLANGEGVPGAFPPLHTRVAAIAALEGGREYLISVVAFGLMGQMTVDGVSYVGFMPGNSGTYEPAVLAAALNHLLYELSDQPADEDDAFSAEELQALIDATDAPGPMTAQKMREALLERHGEQWPD